MDISNYNILTVIQALGISVTKSSSNNYNGLCPFHLEKTPSFVVYPLTNTWHCFGCGRGHSVIDLVKEKKNINFYDAMKWLKENVDFIFDDDLPKLNKPLVSEPLKTINNELIQYWHNLLYHSKRYKWFEARGFTEATIKQECFGWDGSRYIIPIWQGEPGASFCLGVKKRVSEFCSEGSLKYIGKRGHNNAYVWGKWHVRNAKYMFIFIGELDAALAVQDKLPAVSFVGGVNALAKFPKNWSYLWFPHIKIAIFCGDRKEAVFGGKAASEWEKQKGRKTSYVFHWTKQGNDFSFDDYNEFRLKPYGVNDFINMVTSQIPYNNIKNGVYN